LPAAPTVTHGSLPEIAELREHREGQSHVLRMAKVARRDLERLETSNKLGVRHMYLGTKVHTRPQGFILGHTIASRSADLAS
jgi:hypothetical protein